MKAPERATLFPRERAETFCPLSPRERAVRFLPLHFILYPLTPSIDGPCFVFNNIPLNLEFCLPVGVRGPVERRALERLAARSSRVSSADLRKDTVTPGTGNRNAGERTSPGKKFLTMIGYHDEPHLVKRKV
jgi:hypothetical protein